MDYKLLTSGNGRKIEQFGEFTLSRPCDFAVWPVNRSVKAHASFERKKNELKWNTKCQFPEKWIINLYDVKVVLKLTPFGHVGLFYEHSNIWGMHSKLYSMHSTPKVLNLFAYTGVGSVKMAKEKCSVTHVDSSRAAISWAKENAALNDISNIRWIHEDVMKFMKRECRRNVKYDAIILDPPSFGRGAKGEVFKLENAIWDLINLCKQCLDLGKPNAFITLSSHSEGFSDHLLKKILEKTFKKKGTISQGALFIGENESTRIPTGYYAIWMNR